MNDEAPSVDELSQSPPDSRGGTYLTFRLGDETYGIPILRVKEILKYLPVTAMPRMPEFVRGIVNLRDMVIPVLDLRLRFGMPGKEVSGETCIIVTELRDYLIGVVVDAVRDVLDIDEGKIEDPPSFGTTVRTDFISGLGKTEDDVVILLDIGTVFSDEETETVATLAEAAAPDMDSEKEEK